jgi:hypothetical protein
MSAKSTATSTCAPPSGSRSKHQSQSEGFLRDGPKPTRAKGLPKGPANGRLQSLQRGKPGRRPITLRIATCR